MAIDPVRHGDVLIWPIDPIDPIDVAAMAVLAPTPHGYVLTRGSATGHEHVLVGSDVAVYVEKEDSRIVRLGAPAQLVHYGASPRHEPIELAPGWYRQSIKRQATPDGWENVQD